MTIKKAWVRLRETLVIGIGILLGLSLWIQFFFGTVEIRQLSFVLASGRASLGSVDFYWLVWLAVALTGTPVTLLALHRWVLRVLPALTRWPKTSFLRTRFPALLTTVVVVGGLIHAAETLSVRSAFATTETTTLISDTYVEPSWTMPPDVQPKNLILIYVESLERSLTEEALWGENYIRGLTDYTASWITPTSFLQMAGARWTIEGVVSSQCGIPLRPLSFANTPDNEVNHNEIGDQIRQFLPGVNCLGDVLAANGYSNTFMGGARKAFASKGDFLSEHGYQTVLGWEDWSAIGEVSDTRWGLHDDRLLSYAQSKVDELEASGEPYNLTILTVDSHLEGLMSEECRNRGVDNLAGIFGCSTDLVVDFLDFVENRGYLEDTVVVIMGDHLMAPGSISDRIPEDYERNVFFAMKNDSSPRAKSSESRAFLHVDVLPTILEALGFESLSGRAGLGLSLYSNDETHPLADDNRFPDDLMKADQIWYEFWLGQRQSF